MGSRLVVDDEATLVGQSIPPIAADEFRGGTQVVEFQEGWLTLIDEPMAGETFPAYRHRFVWLDRSWVLRGVSLPFFFIKRGLELASGLAWHPDGKRLLISYGVDDAQAWLATVDADEVRHALAEL